MRNESHALSIAFAFWCERLLWEALMKFTCHPFRGKFLSSVFPLHIDRQQTNARSRQLSLAVPSRHQVHRRRSTPAPLPVHVLWKHWIKPAWRLCTQSACRFSVILPRNSLPYIQYACGISMQSAEKSDYASYAQALCSVSIMISHFRSFRTISDRPFLRGSSPHKKSLHYIHNRAPRNVALSRKNFWGLYICTILRSSNCKRCTNSVFRQRFAKKDSILHRFML